MCPIRLKKPQNKRHGNGFTILEVLVATTVLTLLLAIMLAVMNQTSSTVMCASAKIDAFATARSTFDIIVGKLSQATLNTYWDYDDPSLPRHYLRKSDLQFLTRANTQYPGYGQEIFFQVPESYSSNANYQGTEGILNACGYFVRYSNDDNFRPGVVNNKRWRYRLMEAIQPTEEMQVFRLAANDDTAWATNISMTNAIPLCENVIALIVWPRLSAGADVTGTQLTSNYQYDSQKNANSYPQPITANQLPPTVQVTLVVIDDASAVRLDTHSDTPPQVIYNALQNKFTDVTKYQQDLSSLASILTTHRIKYQIRNISVVLQESKWSSTP
ncbi:MAG: prepilin-type N-terminal cleavage/methylation domain-containing protein [Chthoniobacteraceae bacterium]